MSQCRMVRNRRAVIDIDVPNLLTHVRQEAHYASMNDKSTGRIPTLTLGWRLKMALGDYPAQSIADDLGVNRATVSRWMGDKGAPPKAGFIKQWALITKTNAHWLLTGEEEV